MVVCGLVQLTGTGSIALARGIGYLTLAQLCVVSLVLATSYVLFSLAETAALPSVVSRDDLPAAIAQNQAVLSLSSLISQPIGGALVQVARAVPFVADAVSYLASVLSLTLIRVPFQRERMERTASLGTEIVEGIRFLWGQPVLRAMGVMITGFHLLGAGTSLMIILQHGGRQLPGEGYPQPSPRTGARRRVA